MIIPLLSGIAVGLIFTVLGTLFYASDEDGLYPSEKEAIVSGLQGTAIGTVVLFLILLFY